MGRGKEKEIEKEKERGGKGRESVDNTARGLAIAHRSYWKAMKASVARCHLRRPLIKRGREGSY